MGIDNEILQEEIIIPKDQVGKFCDVSKILDSDFSQNKEYKNILEELKISDTFQGKSEKKIILLRHFEDNKGNSTNGELTDNGLNHGKKKSEILKNYLQNSKTLIRYAGIGKNREIVNRTSQTAELLVNNLDNISGIVQEDGLDSIYKNDDKKIKNLVEQEVKTIDFLETFKEEQNIEKSQNPEIWIVHKTNMDKILREVLDILPENKAFYGALDFGETVEFDMGYSDDKKEKVDFLKINNSLIKLTNTNYLEIISKLEETENIPENIKKGINYFKDGKIKIIDLQNVINKNILEDNSFLEQFKNSENINLRKLSFINILEKNNSLDDEVEKVIMEDEFSEKVEETLDIFYEVIIDSPDIKVVEEMIFDYENKKVFFNKLLKIISSIDSTKFINIDQNNKLFKIYDYFKNNGNSDLVEYEEKIENSIIGLGKSKIFGENLDMFKYIFDVGKEIENQDFIFRINLSENLEFSLSYKENGKNKDYILQNKDKKEFSFINSIFIEYIKKYYNFEPNIDRDYGKNVIINFVFKNGRLVLEREEILSHFEGYLNHNNLSVLSECENYLEKSFIEGKIFDDFNTFIEENKKFLLKYLESKVENILVKIKSDIFSIFLKDSKDKKSLSNTIANITWNKTEILNIEQIIGTKKEEDLKILKKNYLKKSKILNILISKINPTFNASRNISLETFKDLNLFFIKIKD